LRRQGVGDREPIEQLATGVPEQIRDRTGIPERHQRRVDAVLQRRAMTDQMQPVARELTLTTNRRIRQPDRRHQITPGQLGQHARVDPVGLASQRSQPLDLLRVGDQYLPAQLLERVVHESRARHRLDHRPHLLPSQALGDVAQTVGVRRCRGVFDDLASVVDQADIEPASTQTQPSIQHTNGPPRARCSMTRRACHRGGPLSSQSKAKVTQRVRSRVRRRYTPDPTGLVYERPR